MNNNRFWRFTLVYAVGFLLLRGISFFLLPIYTNLLSTSDAGVVFLIYTILAFLNPVYAYGMNAALFKFYSNKEYDNNQVISTSFVSLIITSLFLSFLIFLGSGSLNMLISNDGLTSSNWFLFIAIILFFDSFSSRVFVVIRLLEKPTSFLLVGLFNIVLSLICNYYFIGVLNLSSFGAIVAIAAVSVSQACILFFPMLQYIKFKNFNFPLLKKMVVFALPFLPAALLFVIIGFSDRWFINYYLTLHDVGLYGAGYKIGSIMSLLVTGFMLNWQPYFLKKNNNDDNEFGKIGSIAIVCFITVLTLLCLFVNHIVQLSWHNYYLIGKEFWSCVSIIPLVALGYFFYGIYVLQMPSIFICNKQNWSVGFWCLGAVCNIFGNVFLIPKFGIVGAASSTSISYCIMMVAIIIKNYTWLPIKYSIKHLVAHAALSVCVALLFSWLAVFENIVFSLLLVFFYLIISLFILKSITLYNFAFNHE